MIIHSNLTVGRNMRSTILLNREALAKIVGFVGRTRGAMYDLALLVDMSI